MKKYTKNFLFFLLMIITIFATSGTTLAKAPSEASDGKNMTKFIDSYKNKKFKTAKKYMKKMNKYAKEACVSNMSKKMKKAYAKALKKYPVDYYYTDSPYLWDYHLTDFDGDGRTELLAVVGRSEGDVKCIVYKYKNKKAVKIGSFGCGHSAFLAYPKHNGIVLSLGHMGYESVYTVKYKNGKIVKKELAHREVGDSPYITSRCKLKSHYDYSSNFDPCIDLTPLSTSKKAFYKGSIVGSRAKTKETSLINSVTIKEKKLIVKGNLFKAASSDDQWNGFNSWTGYKTKEFKLSSKVKYYILLTESDERISKKEFLKMAKTDFGRLLEIYVNSKGLVYKVKITAVG